LPSTSSVCLRPDTVWTWICICESELIDWLSLFVQSWKLLREDMPTIREISLTAQKAYSQYWWKYDSHWRWNLCGCQFISLEPGKTQDRPSVNGRKSFKKTVRILTFFWRHGTAALKNLEFHWRSTRPAIACYLTFWIDRRSPDLSILGHRSDLTHRKWISLLSFRAFTRLNPKRSAPGSERETIPALNWIKFLSECSPPLSALTIKTKCWHQFGSYLYCICEPIECLVDPGSIESTCWYDSPDPILVLGWDSDINTRFRQKPPSTHPVNVETRPQASINSSLSAFRVGCRFSIRCLRWGYLLSSFECGFSCLSAVLPIDTT
jgi:hypothetical protein